MAWKKSRLRHPETIEVGNVRFLSEQDGSPERELKQRFVDFFQRDKSILAAYLARVAYGQIIAIALCLRCQFGSDQGMAEKIGKLFALMFGNQEQLDIIFLTDRQEIELMKVCSPFFEARPGVLGLKRPALTRAARRPTALFFWNLQDSGSSRSRSRVFRASGARGPSGGLGSLLQGSSSVAQFLPSNNNRYC